MLLLREITSADLLPSYALARQFNLYNFPLNAHIIKSKIEASQESFKGERNKMNSVYLFALQKWPEGDLIGVSQIKAMNGTLSLPDYYFNVSSSLIKGQPTTCLTLKAQHFGHSELGGLLLDKKFRGQGAGRFLSLGRLLFMGARMQKFQNIVYAQLAPVMSSAGESIFWEVLGKNFTGLSFDQANEYSRQDQKFVPQFFPAQRIYIYEDDRFFTRYSYMNNTPHLEMASQIFEADELRDIEHKLNLAPHTFPHGACVLVVSSFQKLHLGRGGVSTRAARSILEKQGFEYQRCVHPFDGGPHLGAQVKKVEIIQRSKWYRVSEKKLSPHGHHTYMWLAYLSPVGFRAAPTHYKIEGEQVLVPELTHQALQLQTGARVYAYCHLASHS